MNNTIKDAIRFMIINNNHLLRPDKPIHKGLDPTFYHTGNYDSEVTLMKLSKYYEELLQEFIKND